MAYRDQVLPVAAGGSGVATLTNHGLLRGSGTSAIGALAVGTNGQVVVGSTGADPAFATLGASAGSLTYTTGANTLNIDIANYADTTFTPALQFGGASVGITYTTQVGKYVRIGNLVFISIEIQLSNKGSSTGAARISGLPFNNNASTNIVVPVEYVINSFPASTVASFGFIIPSAGAVQLFAYSTTTITQLADTNFANTSIVRATGFYFAA